ncbi:GDP-mannose 4,6-dehydratase [Planctomycetota bacterium]
MRALITGAAGFIGSHLSERLLSQQWQVIGLDNFDPFYDSEIKKRNLATSHAHPNFQFLEGDIRNTATVAEACTARPDVIIHLAARAGVRPSIADPMAYNDFNINGTMVMLEAARTCGVPKFVFASSSSVYGNNMKVPFSEDDPVDWPISPYAATKKAGELLCHTYHHLYGIDMTCLRFFTVYGPRQRPDLAIHKFARLILKNEPITIFGDGSMQRDFTFIGDIIDGINAAIERCQGYHIYNLGESQPVTVKKLIEELEQALGKTAICQREPEQPGDVRQTYADISRARRELDYRPHTDRREGLKAFADWITTAS